MGEYEKEDVKVRGSISISLIFVFAVGISFLIKGKEIFGIWIFANSSFGINCLEEYSNFT